jgi:choline dehydrogenase-like flavoprotein
VQGCIFGAKSSVDQTAIPRGERTGRLVVESGARALQLETAADGRVTAAVYRRGGEMRRAVGRVFVLAMGALETPRLLLVSQDGRAARGTGNDADQVGRHLTETVWVGLTVRFDERLEPYKGPPIDARIWDFNRPAQPGRSGFGLGVSGTMSGYHGPVSYAERTPGFGLVHKRAMRERFGTIVTLFGIADHEPRAENRVELSDQTDSEGVPLLRVRSSYSEADRAVVGEMMRRCRELAEASGARETVDLYSSYDRPASSHPAGTCRMGADPASSVVDAWGRVHGVANLYITDASVLPGQGAGDAPTLTIQALALRTAGHIAARARRREL